jgi:hypothetical protein
MGIFFVIHHWKTRIGGGGGRYCFVVVHIVEHI